MKMKKTILSILILIQSTASFALTEQINFAQSYSPTSFEYDLSLLDEYFEEERKIHIANKQPNSKVDGIIKYKKKILTEYLNNYVEIKKDIGPSHKKNPLVYLAKFQNKIGIDDQYNQEFTNFVKKKQKENGLLETGILDQVTWFSVYQQPTYWKEDTISKAVENWNAILEKHATHKNNKMIIVNLPSMQLFLYERDKDSNYKLLMKSNIVVGRVKNQTPLKNFEIISIKYNPTWTPTRNMLKRNLYNDDDTLNVKWIEDHGLVMYDENGAVRPLSEIDQIKNPRFTQEPGSDNALGVLKFETNSKDDIYLHDTNEKALFKHNTRLHSSGCVRVQNFMELASLISSNPKEKVQEYINKEETHYKGLPKIPVYIDYSQVLFKENGEPTFYPDVYNKN